MVKMHHGTLLVKRTAKEIWHGWLAPVCIKLSSSWFQKEKRGVAPAIFQAAWISPPPSPPPYTPYKLDVVFNFFWMDPSQETVTNQQPSHMWQSEFFSRRYARDFCCWFAWSEFAYLVQRIQQPFLKLQILTFHKSFNNSDCFGQKIDNKYINIDL